MSHRFKIISLYIISICVAVFFAAMAGYVYAAERTPVMPIASQPMIDVETRIAYQRGDISKDTARKRIETRLSELRAQEAIIDWEFNEDTSTYTILMNSNTVFTYQLP